MSYQQALTTYIEILKITLENLINRIIKMKSFDYIISLIILVTKVEELMVILVDSVLSKILPNIETAIKKGESDGLQKKIKGRVLIK